MLVLDIGNTFTKWCLVQGGGASIVKKFKTENLKDEFPKLLNQHAVVDYIYVSSVRSIDLINQLRVKHLSKRVSIVLVRPEKERGGLKNGYVEYEKLGVDRWLAMVAAWVSFGRACCVVCAGTALTIDLVDSAGQHLGGYILPGMRTMITSLNLSTDLIDCSLIQENDKLELNAGRTTMDAVQHGAVLALVGALQQSLQLLCMKSGSNEPVCVIGGGDAQLLAQILDERWIKNEFLVMDGLKLYAENRWQI